MVGCINGKVRFFLISDVVEVFVVVNGLMMVLGDCLGIGISFYFGGMVCFSIVD